MYGIKSEEDAVRVAGVQGLKQEAYPRRCSVAGRVGLSNRTRTSEACVSGRSHDGPKEEGSGLGAGRLYTDSVNVQQMTPATLQIVAGFPERARPRGHRAW